MLNKQQQRFLKKRAQKLPASLQIGKNGLAVINLEQLQQQLNNQELVKVSVLQNAIVSPIDVITAVQNFDRRILKIQAIGRVIVFYKRAPQKAKRNLSLEVDQIR